MKTSKQIESDIIALLRGSALESGVNGQVYREGLRPRDSKKEDIIVSFISGLPGYPSTGVVAVNIYVPDISPRKDGIYVENGRRVAAVEQMADTWVQSLKANVSDYRFSLDTTIQSVEDEAINQHFVVVRLKFKIHDNI